MVLHLIGFDNLPLYCSVRYDMFEYTVIPGGGPRVVVSTAASDRQGSNFESRVWRTVSSQSSHQEVLLAQFSLYVQKGGLKPDSFHSHRGGGGVPTTPYRSTAKLFNCNFHSLEVVSRLRDQQLKMSENYSGLANGGQRFCNLLNS